MEGLSAKHRLIKQPILVQLIIWLTAVCLMFLVFFSTLTPIREEVYFTTGNYAETELLHPGDYVTQSFRSAYDRITEVSFALSYDENIPDTTTLLKVLSDGEIVVEQPLTVNACVNQTLLPVTADIRNCLDKTITIQVENGSVPTDSGSFSLMASDKEYLYLDSMEDYRYNNNPEEGRLLSSMTYITGYTWYRSLTYAFWIFLTGLVLSHLAAAGMRPLNRIQLFNLVSENIDHKQGRKNNQTSTK